MGFSNNGIIPIAEIQFLAYFHNAEDQLREAATLSFFSKGQFLNPMVLRIPGLAYQKDLVDIFTMIIRSLFLETFLV